MPHHLELRDAAAHRRVARRSRAARRRSACAARTAPAAISACGTAPVASTTQRARISPAQRRSRRDGCQASLPRRRCAAPRPHARELRRRAAAPRSAPARSMRAPASHRGAAEDLVEHLARQHRQRARARRRGRRAGRCSRAWLARCATAASPRRTRRGARARAWASGISPSPQTLSRGKRVLVDQHRVEAGARQQLRAGAAGRAGADDEHVAAVGERGRKRHRAASGERRAASTRQGPAGPACSRRLRG